MGEGELDFKFLPAGGNIPFVLVGGGLGFKSGQSLKFDKVTHNRLWLSIANAFGHHLPTFGHKGFSEGGALPLG